MLEGDRKREQFRWVTVWLMPLPLTILVVGALGTLLRSSLDQPWARACLVLVAAAAYLLGSAALRRALPRIQAHALGFRPLTSAEHAIVARLLEVDDPPYERLRGELPYLLACTLDKWGSFALLDMRRSICPERKVARGLPFVGLTHDADDVPIQLTLMVSEEGDLFAVEVTRLDGKDLVAPDWRSISLARAGPP